MIKDAGCQHLGVGASGEPPVGNPHSKKNQAQAPAPARPRPNRAMVRHDLLQLGELLLHGQDVCLDPLKTALPFPHKARESDSTAKPRTLVV